MLLLKVALDVAAGFEVGSDREIDGPREEKNISG